jgi:hypothetical protein
LDENAKKRPSGDQRGVESLGPDVKGRARPEPSACAIQMLLREVFSSVSMLETTNATIEPSGET